MKLFYQIGKTAMMGSLLTVAILSSTQEASAAEEGSSSRSYEAVHKRGNSCTFGLLSWCLTEHPEPASLDSKVPLEIDLFGTYKVTSNYYTEEAESCKEVGCSLDQQGWSNGLSVGYRLKGNGRSDKDFGVGVAISTMPVVQKFENNPGFQGSLGPVAAGDGSLGYTSVRLIMRRRHFFYLMRSEYLVSTFGVGFAVPNAQNEAGESFPGADGIKTTLGGRFGVQVPITEHIEIGLVDHWGVWWYGSSFGESAYMSSYGLHMSARL